MPTIAQGIRKTTSIGLQTALGTPNVTTGQIVRRKNSVFQAMRDMFESDEIVSHHMSTGSAYGLKKAQGKIDGLCSALTYQLPFEGLLEKVFTATAPLVLGVDVTSQAVIPQITDPTTSFLTGGIKTGDVVQFTGFTTTAVGNNSRNWWITAVTATQLTGVFLDGGAAMLPKAPETGSVTVTVVGKKCLTPLTGHTNSYYTFEEYYSDLPRSELFPDCKIAQIALGLPATGNATISIDVVGLGIRTPSAVQQVVTRSAETSTPVIAAINGFIYVNGAVAGNITGAQITISNSAANMGAVIGSNNGPDVQKGRIRVSGNFTGFFQDAVFSTFYDGETNISLALVMTGDQTSTSTFLGFTLGRIKITGDSPDDGEKGIVRTYPFIAEYNITGGAALAFDQTILTVQDSNAA